ncbi:MULTISPECIES: class A sortase SrtA [unclassified Staphylococcus]|uniref:class A sortase SrtA n=1 Tax=unclassified Staphylococcus TaxID=91994 RepID=UPI0021D2114B|nr:MULTISPECIES: class A sortase SrtA [unclassified Staphylococcus]UXR78146.1 class A sortase SrtA [Staphylococcus sp. IVB6227]UXR82310.1 class A sortase SrtA [Staphylococcus sp. IVB6214]
MKQLKNILVPLLGIVLILGGLYLVFKTKIDSYFAQQETEQKIEQYESKKQPAQQEIPKDKSQVVGVLTVPSVDIKEAVYPGAATPEQLKRGLAFAEEDESLSDQNISIAGHTDYNLYNQFTDLHKAKKGDAVTFKVGNEERKYKITSIKDVDPTQVEVLEEMNKEKDQLTLITCDDYDPNTGQWLKRSIYVAEAA